MYTELDITVLMLDGCTRSEARKILKDGAAIIFDDFERNFDSYMMAWGVDADEISEYRYMIETGRPCRDWGVVNDGDDTFYIMYIL